MKFTTRTWTFFRRNWDVVLTMVIAATIAVLSYLQRVEPQVVSTAILSILFLIACGLLVSRETNDRLQQTTEEIWGRLRKPSIDEIITPYEEWIREIRANLTLSMEVWILSRTCSRFWEDYDTQLIEVLNRGGTIRLLSVDPKNGALRMIANSVELARARDLEGTFRKVTAENCSNQLVLWQARVNDFAEYITRLASNYPNNHLDLRFIDYLPAHTLVIINGGGDQGMMFVELGTFQANGRHRPTFSLLKMKDKELFALYHDEYQVMWDSARPVDGSQEVERNSV